MGLVLATIAPVGAHGELILQLGAERIQPGGAIEVRGDLGSGEQFEIALISKANGSRRWIATIPATEEGHFQSHVVVPADVPEGDYLVEASFDLAVVRAPLTVAGTPINPGEGGEGPDRADSLAVPLPSGFRQDGTSAGGSGAAGTRGGRSPADGLLVVGAAIAAAAALIGSLRLVGRRRSAASGGRPGP